MKQKLTMILMLLVTGFGFVLTGAQSAAGQTDTDGDGVPDVSDNCPTTPNPEKIAFDSFRDGNYEIYVMNADGSNPVNLTNNPAHDLNAEFSPDGSKIVFTSLRSGRREIYVMSADGSNPTRLTFNATDNRSPSFSSDGSKIVFTSFPDFNSTSEIYVINADGTNPIRLTNNAASDYDPKFLPDGAKIIFVSDRDGNGNDEIYMMNSDGSNPINLTNNPADDINPTFSPDGSKIAFTSFRGGNIDVYAMNADGSNPVNLTNNAAIDASPWFSPDGSKIAFSSRRDGNPEIYVMNADGSNPARLTDNPADDFTPAWGRQADADGDGIGDACDNAAPVARCRNVAVTLDPDMTTAVADVNDGSFDPDGDPLMFDYNPAGPYQVGSTLVTLTVMDGNGGSDFCTGTVAVLYRFSFFELSDLLSNPQYFIEATAGNDVPIKFSLSGFKGDNPYNSPPVSQRISCINKNPIGQAQQVQTRGGAVNYNATFDVYQTTWRTNPNWAGTCRRLTLFLKDGTMQSLDFRFN